MKPTEFGKARFVENYAPKLRDQWLTLKPFQDVIHTVWAGPQGEGSKEQQYIALDFSTWEDGEIVILCQWIIREDGVFCQTEDGRHPSSMDQLWSYLRQLPRPAHSFYL